MSSFKDDFDKFFNSKKASRTLTPKDCAPKVSRYRAPKGKSKPVLFDPDAPQCGPVKVYTKEEIAEYEREHGIGRKDEDPL